MTPTDTHIGEWSRLSEELRVFHWRTERLVALGYDVGEASSLALSTLDIHELEDLIGRGCPPGTAVRIAA